MAELVVLGSGTGFPTKRRSSPGLLLKSQEHGNTLMDPGPGAIGKMTGHGISMDRVNRVLITHLHLDHTLDLMALFFARDFLKKHVGLNPLKVFGPKGLADLVNKMIGLYGEMISPKKLEYGVEELTEGALPRSVGIPGQAFKMTHRSYAALGYRLNTDSKTLAVSGDTDLCDNLQPLGKGADLFVLECSFPQEMGISGHLSPDSAGDAAAMAQPKKLLLYHLYPQIKEEDALIIIQKKFKGQIALAEDNGVYTI